MIKTHHGDLLTSSAEFICHQVNCMGKMNSGVAKQIREEYPIVFHNYEILTKHWQVENKKESALLGSIQLVKIPNEDRTIANMFSQNNYGYDGKRYTDVEAFETCIKKIVSKAKEMKVSTIAMPYKIASVRGGADWDTEIYPILKKYFKDSNDFILELWRYNK